MKTGTITIRLPEDKIQRLKELAKKQNISVTELLREPITTWLDLGAIGQSSNEEVLERIEKLDTNIQGALMAHADLGVNILKAALGARIYACKAAENGDEVVSFMAREKALTAQERKKYKTQREKEIEKVSEQLLALILGVPQQQPDQG